MSQKKFPSNFFEFFLLKLKLKVGRGGVYSPPPPLKALGDKYSFCYMSPQSCQQGILFRLYKLKVAEPIFSIFNLQGM